jgi:prepilin-type N-terminal cleavage/methylation domain-containing protein
MNRGGYTLVEMVITMVIVGVLAFVFIPRSYVDNSRAGAAGRKLLADLRYAQQLSTTTQLRSGIVILAGSYSVFTNNTSASTATDPLTGNPFIVNMTGNFAGVTLTAPGINNGIIRFDSLGIPYQGLDGGQTLLGAAETINIFSGAALIKTITIQPTTGQIAIN